MDEIIVDLDRVAVPGMAHWHIPVGMLSRGHLLYLLWAVCGAGLATQNDVVHGSSATEIKYGFRLAC